MLGIARSRDEKSETEEVWVNVKPKKVRDKPLSRIKKREMLERYKKKCDESMELTETITRISAKNRRHGDERGKTEEMWGDVKDIIGMLEDLVSEIAEEGGGIEFKHINKVIKVDRDIAKKIEGKVSAWKEVRKNRDE